jgi:hypothetical protein
MNFHYYPPGYPLFMPFEINRDMTSWRSPWEKLLVTSLLQQPLWVWSLTLGRIHELPFLSFLPYKDEMILEHNPLFPAYLGHPPSQALSHVCSKGVIFRLRCVCSLSSKHRFCVWSLGGHVGTWTHTWHLMVSPLCKEVFWILPMSLKK